LSEGREPLKVLVVTDDLDLRRSLEYGVTSQIVPEFVRDAREALSRMDSEAPSAVVVDLQTGSAGGYSLAEDMSADARLANIPIVMMLERPQDEWLARQAGARACLVKPARPDSVIRQIVAATTAG
jgi:DNA-binding response OmpR family regulator